jgi:hypothetical protein
MLDREKIYFINYYDYINDGKDIREFIVPVNYINHSIDYDDRCSEQHYKIYFDVTIALNPDDAFKLGDLLDLDVQEMYDYIGVDDVNFLYPNTYHMNGINLLEYLK